MKKQLLFGTALAIAGVSILCLGDASATTQCQVKIEDSSYDSLEEAVKAASDNAIIKVYPGACNIQKDDTTIVSGQSGWYLPITKAVTIMGVDESGNEITDPNNTKATIYSSTYVANGAWASQNLITILHDNVTISGLTIMDKPDGNKSIEVVNAEGFTSDNFIAKNNLFTPLTANELTLASVTPSGYSSVEEYLADASNYGATLYLSGDIQNATIDNNIFSYSSLSFDHPNNAIISVTNNVFNGTKAWGTDYIYSSVGYTNWSAADFDLTNLQLTFSDNIFSNAGKVNFSKATDGVFDFSHNYWGTATPDFDEIFTANNNDARYISEPYYTQLTIAGTIDTDSLFPVTKDLPEGYTTKTTSTKISTEEQAAIDELKIDGFTSAATYDITILDEDGEQVNGLEKAATFTLPLPTNLLPVQDGFSRSFDVIRVHEYSPAYLEATKLNSTTNADGTISFSSNIFSTFVIGYVDTKNPVTPSAPNTGYSQTEAPSATSSTAILTIITATIASIFAGIKIFKKQH